MQRLKQFKFKNSNLNLKKNFLAFQFFQIKSGKTQPFNLKTNFKQNSTIFPLKKYLHKKTLFLKINKNKKGAKFSLHPFLYI